MTGRQAVMVEADAALASNLRAALETCGFSVEVLPDAATAASKLSESTPELVLLDVEPAVRDTLCKLVKKKRKQTPIFVLSGKGENEGVLRRWFGKAPDVVLRKPVVVDDLLKEVRQLFKLDAPPAAHPSLGEDMVQEMDDLVMVDGQEQEEEETDVKQTGNAAKNAPNPPNGFAREHEALALRQRINALEKQIIDLREDIDKKERLILQHKHTTLDIERKANALNETILGLEQKLLAANERIDTQDREAEALMSTIQAKDDEMKAEKARGQQALAAAAEDAKRQKNRAEMEHAGQLDKLRKEHDAALARQASEAQHKHDAAVAMLEGRVAKALDTLRANARQVEQAREVLNNAAALLGKNVGTVTFDDAPPELPKKR